MAQRGCPVVKPGDNHHPDAGKKAKPGDTSSVISIHSAVLKFSSARVRVNEGETLRVSFERSGGSTGAVEVFYETQTGNASTADVSPVTGSIQWADGDLSVKTIEIPIAADVAGDEFTETFFVRLYNPRSGLALAAPNIMVVDIADKPDEPIASSSAMASSQAGSVTSSVASSPNASVTSSLAAIAPSKKSGGGSTPLVVIMALASLICLRRFTWNRGGDHK